MPLDGVAMACWYPFAGLSKEHIVIFGLIRECVYVVMRYA